MCVCWVSMISLCPYVSSVALGLEHNNRLSGYTDSRGLSGHTNSYGLLVCMRSSKHAILPRIVRIRVVHAFGSVLLLDSCCVGRALLAHAPKLVVLYIQIRTRTTCPSSFIVNI